MKPLKLVMSAFGPFGREAVVDFESLGTNGVYLITGDTGSGKTTIFDAISYALYGEASGGKERRNVRNFRSDYATPKTPTFVRLEFEQHGRHFEVMRAPAYEREALRKGGKDIVRASAKAHLRDLDSGEYLAQKSDAVTKQIEQLLGLNRNQFAQTVMIAQGDFQKILSAKSDDRKAIFQRLFQTHIYEQFQIRLKDLNGECTARAERLQEALRISMQRGVLEDVPEEVQPTLQNPTEYLKYLRQKNADFAARRDAANAKEEAFQKAADDALTMLTEGRNRNRLLEKLEQKRTALAALEGQRAEMTACRGRIEAAKRAAVVTLQANRLAEQQQHLSETQAKLASVQQQLAVQASIVQQAQARAEEARTAAQGLEDLRTELVSTQEALRLVRMRGEKQADYDRAAANLLVVRQKSEAAEQAHRTALDAFLLGQAGILAQKLEAGKPCPVCGSRQHPMPAVSDAKIPTESRLKTLQKDAEKCTAAYQEAAQRCAALQAELESITTHPAMQARKDVTSEQLETEIAALQKRITALEQEQRAAEQNLQKEQTQQAKLSGSVQELQASETRWTADVARQSAVFAETLQAQGFAAEEAYLAARMEEKALQELERRVNAYDQNLLTLQTEVKQLQEETAGKEPVNLEELEREQTHAEAERNAWKGMSEKCSTSLAINEGVIGEMEAVLQEQDGMREEWAMIDELYKAVSGQLGGGKAKFRLEAYVQQYYFRRVVASANERLKLLTDDTFVLKCSEDAKNLNQQSGLDLEVLDRNTGLWRDVSTLSGGESFLASLSLALGLSEVVQDGSGGVLLDSMFIDEGFGTLDAHSLRQALQLLDKLADGKRMIGIISHVDTLKQRIDRKIVVTKTWKGAEVWMG